jgi:hypothetical protein
MRDVKTAVALVIARVLCGGTPAAAQRVHRVSTAPTVQDRSPLRVSAVDSGRALRSGEPATVTV